MKKIQPALFISALLISGMLHAGTQCDKRYYSPEWHAQAPTVNAFNYVRAETEMQFRKYATVYQAFGKFAHGRKAYDVHKQVTTTGNRDTRYSFGVFDLSKSPLTITLPDAKGRYMSLMLISQDHDIYPATYAPGSWTFTQEEIGTRYVMFGIRTLVDPNDDKDMAEVSRLQDMVKVEQKDKGDLSGLQDWNEKQMLKLRKAYNTLGLSMSDSSTYFGVKCDRSYLMNAMGAAVGWGGMQRRDALYFPATVKKNDGKTPYVLHVPKDVPFDGFWSVTVYNKDRYMVPNKLNAYAFNNVTAKKNKDGSTTIHFGGDPKADNYIPIMDGWMYVVRVYRPRKELLDGKWSFPEAKEAK